MEHAATWRNGIAALTGSSGEAPVRPRKARFRRIGVVAAPALPACCACMEHAATWRNGIAALTGSSGEAPVRPRKARFRRIGVVAARLPAYSARVPARRTPMKTANRLAVFAFAVALNAVAIAALHIAMVDGAERAIAAN